MSTGFFSSFDQNNLSTNHIRGKRVSFRKRRNEREGEREPVKGNGVMKVIIIPMILFCRISS